MAAIFAIITAVSVILAAVLLRGATNGDIAFDTEAPTVLPTLAPTNEDDPWRECYGSTQFANFNLRLTQRTNTDKFADISLCAGSRIEVGTLESYPVGGRLPPLNLQSNMRVRCDGTIGDLANRCVVTGRDSSAYALVVNARESFAETAAENVTIEGITFEDAPQNLV